MDNKKILLFKSVLYLSIFYVIIDTIYKIIKNINVTNKEQCIVNQFLGKSIFFFFESFIELFVIVLVGVFLAVILENYFLKFKNLYPKNVFSAFLFGSILPICACTVIPFVYTLKNKIKTSVIITFIVAAPLLSPFIIALSLGVLGLKYTILRIICAFIIAITSGYIVEYFYKKYKIKTPKLTDFKCDSKGCTYYNKQIYEKTYIIYKKIFPYLILAGILGIIFELLKTHHFISNFTFGNNWLAILIIVLVGVPLYFCNGSEVLFLKPFLDNGVFNIGTAIGFSLTSTALCISAIILLFKFLGKKLTYILIATIVVLTFILSLLISILF